MLYSLKMEKIYPHDLKEIILFLEKAKNIDDFTAVQYLSTNLFYQKNEKEIKQLISDNTNFYINAFDSVLNNEYFVESLNKVLEQYKIFKKNYIQDSQESQKEFYREFDKMEIKNKKLIFSALITSTFFISIVIPYLNNGSITYTAQRLNESVKKLKNILGQKYSSLEIHYVLSSVFDKKYYNKVNFSEKIYDLNYLYKKQRISNYTISLSIRLFFRHSLLNNIFKKMEKNKMEKNKFSLLSIYSINEFIQREKRNKNMCLLNLEEILEKKVMNIFFDSYDKDSNNNNVFNLIEITLKEFESIKNKSTNLFCTIDKTHKIFNELNEYALKNFKAYSGNITNENFEWSNKIFINCCKLLGVLNGLSNVKDVNWKINVSIKEFADWTSSVHKILNKNDIEDDIEKISKYLNQETNKVEWKSTFLTPTQQMKESLSYEDVSKKVFFGIVKTMIGMMNSDGGVIIVGLVEKPEEIKNNEISEKLIHKNKKYFYDVSFELEKIRLDLDGIKRKLQESLKKETMVSLDFFNNLWNIEEISIKSEDGKKEVVVYKIEISKADNLILSSKILNSCEDVDINKTDDIWLSVLKRADGRTIRVDPRKHLTFL